MCDAKILKMEVLAESQYMRLYRAPRLRGGAEIILEVHTATSMLHRALVRCWAGSFLRFNPELELILSSSSVLKE